MLRVRVASTRGEQISVEGVIFMGHVRRTFAKYIEHCTYSGLRLHAEHPSPGRQLADALRCILPGVVGISYKQWGTWFI